MSKLGCTIQPGRASGKPTGTPPGWWGSTQPQQVAPSLDVSSRKRGPSPGTMVAIAEIPLIASGESPFHLGRRSCQALQHVVPCCACSPAPRRRQVDCISDGDTAASPYHLGSSAGEGPIRLGSPLRAPHGLPVADIHRYPYRGVHVRLGVPSHWS